MNKYCKWKHRVQVNKPQKSGIPCAYGRHETAPGKISQLSFCGCGWWKLSGNYVDCKDWEVYLKFCDGVFPIERKVHAKKSQDNHIHHYIETNTNLWCRMLVTYYKDILEIAGGWIESFYDIWGVTVNYILRNEQIRSYLSTLVCFIGGGCLPCVHPPHVSIGTLSTQNATL